MDSVNEFLLTGEPRDSHLMPPMDEASRLVVACHPADFSASALARAVEDTNAHLVNLNVTARRLDDGRLTVELRTNHRNPGAAARSLERYGFEVLEHNGTSDPDDPTDEMLRHRAGQLLKILEI